MLRHLERRVGLEAGDDATAGCVEFGPPAVIVVAEVEHVGRARLDRHLLGGGDVVDVGRRHYQVERLIGIGIVDDVRLGAANSGREPRPIAQLAQPQGGRNRSAGCSRRSCGDSRPARIASTPPAARRTLRPDDRRWRSTTPISIPGGPRDDEACRRGSSDSFRSRAGFAPRKAAHTASRSDAPWTSPPDRPSRHRARPQADRTPPMEYASAAHEKRYSDEARR